MAENWIALQKSIAQDLKADGRAFTFTRPVNRTYDPIAGEFLQGDAAVTAQSYTTYGIIKSISSSSLYTSNYGLAWEPAETVLRGDKLLLTAYADYTPTLEDYIDLDDGRYVVKAVSKVEPAGKALLYYILLRRA